MDVNFKIIKESVSAMKISDMKIAADPTPETSIKYAL
jgi:hypothetical protein